MGCLKVALQTFGMELATLTSTLLLRLPHLLVSEYIQAGCKGCIRAGCKIAFFSPPAKWLMNVRLGPASHSLPDKHSTTEHLTSRRTAPTKPRLAESPLRLAKITPAEYLPAGPKDKPNIPKWGYPSSSNIKTCKTELQPTEHLLSCSLLTAGSTRGDLAMDTLQAQLCVMRRGSTL